MTDNDAEDIAERAISEAAEDKAQERILEVQASADERVAQAQEDARQRTIEARLEALERSGPSAPTSSETPDFAQIINDALSPFSERLAALEASGQATQSAPEPEKESDPFESQIDFAAMAKGTTEKMPRIGHRIFSRVGRR